MPHLTSAALLALLAAGFLVACPRGSELDNAEALNRACDAKPIFEKSCAGALCHGGDGQQPSGGVDLLAPGVEERLLSVPATYENVEEPSTCPSSAELLIDPADPARSLLLTKVLGTHACGERMPIPSPPNTLSPSAIECLRSWIGAVAAMGASEGGSPSGAFGGFSGAGF